MSDPTAPSHRARSGTVRIGLTGPIGCGKSTVAGWLAARGAVVIDADALARVVTDLPEVQEAIFERFGRDLRRPDGSLDRAALGRRVFSDPDRLRELEGLTHPRVRERIETEVATAEAARAPAVVVEAIKLVEGGYAKECDEVWLITCDAATQRTRLEARGMSAADADQRIGAQGDLFVRLAPWASRVISTAGALEETEARVGQAYRTALGSGDAPRS